MDKAFGSLPPGVTPRPANPPRKRLLALQAALEAIGEPQYLPALLEARKPSK